MIWFSCNKFCFREDQSRTRRPGSVWRQFLLIHWLGETVEWGGRIKCGHFDWGRLWSGRGWSNVDILIGRDGWVGGADQMWTFWLGEIVEWGGADQMWTFWLDEIVEWEGLIKCGHFDWERLWSGEGWSNVDVLIRGDCGVGRADQMWTFWIFLTLLLKPVFNAYFTVKVFCQ